MFSVLSLGLVVLVSGCGQQASTGQSSSSSALKVSPLSLVLCQGQNRNEFLVYVKNDSDQELKSCHMFLMDMDGMEVCGVIKPGEVVCTGGTFVLDAKVAYQCPGFDKKEIVLPSVLPEAMDESDINWASATDDMQAMLEEFSKTKQSIQDTLDVKQ